MSRSFVYRERYKLTLMGEVFNLLNIANLGGYSSNVRDTANFGQPQSRADQVFGSGDRGLFNWRRGLVLKKEIGSRFVITHAL